MGKAELKKGDIVLNNYASPAYNDLAIIIGSTSRKTGLYGTTKYWVCRVYFQGKLQTDKSLFIKDDNKLEKIGHFNLNLLDRLVEKEMLNAKEIYESL